MAVVTEEQRDKSLLLIKYNNVRICARYVIKRVTVLAILTYLPCTIFLVFQSFVSLYQGLWKEAEIRGAGAEASLL